MHAARKGIGIGSNTHLEIPIDGDVSLYLQADWHGENLLMAFKSNLFNKRIEVVRGMVVGGVYYRLHKFDSGKE